MKVINQINPQDLTAAMDALKTSSYLILETNAEITEGPNFYALKEAMKNEKINFILYERLTPITPESLITFCTLPGKNAGDKMDLDTQISRLKNRLLSRIEEAKTEGGTNFSLVALECEIGDRASVMFEAINNIKNVSVPLMLWINNSSANFKISSFDSIKELAQYYKTLEAPSLINKIHEARNAGLNVSAIDNNNSSTIKP